MKNRLFLLGSLCLLMLGGCSAQPKLTNQTFVFELGTDVFANPSLYIDNASSLNVSKIKVISKSPGLSVVDNRFVSRSLDYLGVGEYDFALSLDGNEQPFVIKIKDTKAPSIKSAASTIEVPWQSTINWFDYIQADDLSGVYFEAPANLSDSPGESDVDVIIRDRFGNAAIRRVHVVVK